ncbi:signal peptide containing protein [Theileria equi strain WA]|uniref:Signal peptide containing protein n=1 Tax=Theileria equi strain WA TaxID=1537102 RepID=L1L9I9_THEEQ|nr:signal peptide containing protein [Theileria equi strain WA]EKX72161.1 signal peptide containing protein [Theileria equi strain WA]|eukprot:XP_004831613.1 signal peptide containing protein [Theileria equi strain WA]
MKVLALLWAVFLVRFCSAGFLDRLSCFSGSKTDDIQVEQESQVTTTPITLDLTKPDETKLDVHTENESEVSFKEYTPKSAFHISSLTDGDKELWKASGDEKCVFVESYSKGALELLYLETSESSGTKYKYFEKTDGKWNEIDEEPFNEKAKTFIGESRRDGLTLDIAHPSRLLYKSFDYSFAANAVRLVVPNKDTTVTKLVNDTEDVHALSAEEKFDHAKVYLNKDKKPELVLLVTTLSGASKEYYLELQNGKWVSCNDTDAKMRSLRDPADYISDFELDLSSVTSTKECSIFEAELLGVTTRHFYPKPEHLAKKVKDRNKDLWTGISDDDCCLSCLTYKKGNIELLDLTVVEGRSRWYKFFEKSGDGWTSIDKKDYDKKLQEMRKSGSPTTSHPSK